MTTLDTAKTKEKLAALSTFAGRVVHDLNNFSTVIVNVCELIKDDIENNQEAKDKLKMIEDTGERLLAYTQELNNFRLRKEEVNNSITLFELVEHLIRTSQFSCPVEINIDKNLSVKADANKIKLVLENIITNACEASLDKKPVNISANLDNDWIKIISLF